VPWNETPMGRLFALLMMSLALFVVVAPRSSAAAGTSLQGRCVALDYPSNTNFRNVTAPGDIRVLPTDEVILVNKRIPEATRVIFDHATPRHSPLIVVKDCSGTANKFALTISGEIDAGEVVMDGNYGSQVLRRVGDRWMIQ
jgi:hypothetical protein